MQRTLTLWARLSPGFIASSPQLHKVLSLLLCNIPSFFSLFQSPHLFYYFLQELLHTFLSCTPFCFQLRSEKTRGGKGELVEQGWKISKVSTVSWQGNQGARKNRLERCHDEKNVWGMVVWEFPSTETLLSVGANVWYDIPCVYKGPGNLATWALLPDIRYQDVYGIFRLWTWY